jgi:hypothetical protein
MLDRLASIIADVGDNSVSVFKLEDRSDFRNRLEDLRRVNAVFLGDFISGADVRLRNNYTMDGRHWSNIHKCVAMLILVYLT